MTLDSHDRLTDKQRTLAELRQTRADRWASDPVAFVNDCVVFPDGEALADYQEAELAKLGELRRVAVRGPRGSGKTMPAALAFWWFACTSELMGVDWKIPTTAGSWDQIRLYLWPEIHKWYRRINWQAVGLPRPRKGYELLTYQLKLNYGEGFGRATGDPDLIEGAHATRMLVIVDEGKAVPDGIWDSIEGFFANPGDHYVYALGTPGAAVGRFHDICLQRPGFENWTPIHITIDQAIAAGRVTQEWVDGLPWTRDSVPFQTHVLAEFAGAEDGVIPMSWIEAAMSRHAEGHEHTHHPRILAADVADTGSDQTVFATRDEWCIWRVETIPDGSVIDHADKLANRADDYTRRVVIDSIGIGAGTLAAAKRQNLPAEGFVASEKTTRKDRESEFGFINKRAAAWWNLRELLDPDLGEPVSLPNDPELLGDLSAPTWREMAGGRIGIESKDEIRKRLGRSTDVGDAVVMAFWEDQKSRRPSLEGWVVDPDLFKPRGI